MTVDIVAMTEQHWLAVSEIFAQGIATTNATLETSGQSGTRDICRHAGWSVYTVKKLWDGPR